MVRLVHVAGVLVLMLIEPAIASGQIVKHSGSLLDVDAEAGTIALAEIGPWRLHAGTMIITVRTIVVTPETTFALVRRAVEPSTHLSGDFVVEEVERWAIYPGDFVTVDCAHQGVRLVALRITVADTGVP